MATPYIPTVRFRDENMNTIMAGLDMDQVKSIVFEKFIPNIENAIKRKKKTCIFCYVEDEYQVVVSKEDYKNILEVLEQYYISKESYEVCAKIQELIKLL